MKFRRSCGIKAAHLLLCGASLALVQIGFGAEPDKVRTTPKLADLPLAFEANQGQYDSQVRFVSRGSAYSLYLTSGEAVLALKKPVTADSQSRNPGTHRAQSSYVRMQFSGANKNAQVVGQEKLPGTVNYFLGNDPNRWRTGLPTYRVVRYSEIYSGIDLVYYGNQHRLEYDLVVAPHRDPSAVLLSFAGSTQLRLDRSGSLVISADGGNVVFEKPQAYQDIGGRRILVPSSFHLAANHEVTFRLGRYDHARTLVIDPKLEYSTFFGGGAAADPIAIAVDSSGNVYLTGFVPSSGLPASSGAVEPTLPADNDGNGAAFVTKLNSSGSALLYETYLGGSGGYDSYYGTEEGDQALCIAVDSSGNAYIGGETDSSDFPLKTPYQNVYRGHANQTTNGFLTKLNATGTELVYSTYFGGAGVSGIGGDVIGGVAVNSSGDAYITGATYSTSGGDSDFPSTSGAYQTSNHAASAGLSNAFLARFNPAGSALIYSTFLGGTGNTTTAAGDEAAAIAIDASGDAYVTGGTFSTDFPLAGNYVQGSNKAQSNDSANAFLSELNPAGSALLYSTYLGGNGSQGPDFADAIGLGPSGYVYIAGAASSTDFPVSSNAIQNSNTSSPPYFCGFVARIEPTNKSLFSSTYLCGPGDDFYAGVTIGVGVSGIAVDAAGNAYVTGSTSNSKFPVTSDAFQSANGIAKLPTGKYLVVSRLNGFISVLNSTLTSLVYSTYFGGTGYSYCFEGTCLLYGDSASAIALDSSDNIYIAGVASSGDFPILEGAYQTSKPFINAGYVAKFSLSASGTTVETTTTLTSSANPSTTGSSVTFTAHVAPRTGTTEPTGAVGFSVDGGKVTSVSLNSAGEATYTTASLAKGSHSILATYSGSTTDTVSTANLTETIEPVAATPTFSPAAGTYTSAQSVKLADTTAGATIYYTTNGSTPTASSTKYTAAIPVKATETIKAIAVATGYANSAVGSAAYTIK